MLPMLREGKDLFTVVKKGPERCKAGDVVLYRRGSHYILHRVIEVREKDYVILGDNCVNREYGITDDDGDYSKLTEAINNDDNIWSIAADEAGMSTAQYREFMHYKMQAQRAQESQQELVRQQQSRAKAEAWFQEAQTLRAKFPGFDLRAELADPNFVAAISAPGMTLEMAYKAKHFDELMNGTVQAASAATEKRVTQNIRAKGARPAENGTSQRAAATIKSDPSKLTLEDFEEISRRLARGEKITF
jgi:hypothetical protein